MERISIADRNPPRENQGGSQIRNPNFKKIEPQIKQREQRGQNDQEQIRPPFQENYAYEEVDILEDPKENQINLFEETEVDHIFLTKEVLSPQETLLGCSSEMLENIKFQLFVANG